MRGRNGVAHLDQPAPVLVEIVVVPVEVRVAVLVDVREVGVAVRVLPRGMYPVSSLSPRIEFSFR